MSDAPRQEIPLPKGDDDFEDLVLALFREVWQDTGAKLHGRRGQRQDGVDLYGEDRFGRSGLNGVQCKHHGSATPIKDKDLLEELRAEVEKAKGFQPLLQRFIFATTARRSVALSARLDMNDALLDPPRDRWKPDTPQACRCQDIHLPPEQALQVFDQLHEPQADRPIEINDQVHIAGLVRRVACERSEQADLPDPEPGLELGIALPQAMEDGVSVEVAGCVKIGCHERSASPAQCTTTSGTCLHVSPAGRLYSGERRVSMQASSVFFPSSRACGPS